MVCRRAICLRPQLLEKGFYWHLKELFKGYTVCTYYECTFGMKMLTEIRQTAIHTTSATLHLKCYYLALTQKDKINLIGTLSPVINHIASVFCTAEQIGTYG